MSEGTLRAMLSCYFQATPSCGGGTSGMLLLPAYLSLILESETGTFVQYVVIKSYCSFNNLLMKLSRESWSRDFIPK